MERDTKATAYLKNANNFNSHAHVERDWVTTWARHELFNFNSHAHVERDFVEIILFIFFLKISTHTLTWSVTQGFSALTLGAEISTHTLTWSVTSIIILLCSRIIFQLTRSRGA